MLRTRRITRIGLATVVAVLTLAGVAQAGMMATLHDVSAAPATETTPGQRRAHRDPERSPWPSRSARPAPSARMRQSAAVAPGSVTIRWSSA